MTIKAGGVKRTLKPVVKRKPTPVARKPRLSASGHKLRERATGPGKRLKVVPDPAPPTRKAKIKEKDLESLTARLNAAGEKRIELDEQHKESVSELFDVIEEALSLNMPMVRIEEASGISRQWAYSGLKARKRNADKVAKSKRSSKK